MYPRLLAWGPRRLYDPGLSIRIILPPTCMSKGYICLNVEDVVEIISCG
jgi:hypothetical protein